MLTVHAAKGLEFSAVFVPSLGNGKFPVKGQGEFCPPPTGLITSGSDWRLEEEQCLFFVAMSRASDWLCLSRAKRYGKQNSNPSEFLYEIGEHLPQAIEIDATWLQVDPPRAPKPVPENDPSKTYKATDLEIYDQCGHRFYAEVILGVFGNRADSGYLKFHQCVRRTFNQLRAEYRAGKRVDPDKAIEMLEAHWQERRLSGEIHERLYRREAERMVKDMALAMLSANSDRLEVEWTVPLRNGRVSVTPDWVEIIETTAGTRVLVRRLKTGRATKSATPEDVMSLYIKGSEVAFPGAERVCEVLYLMTNEVRNVDLSPKSLKTKLAVYEDAIDGIGRGDFAPRPAERVCPKCAQYFVCPIRLP
jgi:DNA helicase II / ATP-dependent DNA helicase PcrA